MARYKDLYYDATPCPICGKEISDSAQARVSHGRKHVRLGEAEEYTQWDDSTRTGFRTQFRRPLSIADRIHAPKEQP